MDSTNRGGDTRELKTLTPAEMLEEIIKLREGLAQMEARVAKLEWEWEQDFKERAFRHKWGGD